LILWILRLVFQNSRRWAFSSSLSVHHHHRSGDRGPEYSECSSSLSYSLWQNCLFFCPSCSCAYLSSVNPSNAARPRLLSVDPRRRRPSPLPSDNSSLLLPRCLPVAFSFSFCFVSCAVRVRHGQSLTCTTPNVPRTEQCSCTFDRCDSSNMFFPARKLLPLRTLMSSALPTSFESLLAPRDKAGESFVSFVRSAGSDLSLCAAQRFLSVSLVWTAHFCC
jgi:hypothetical protein